MPPTRRFDAAAISRFLDLLASARASVRLRHALEARHESFAGTEARAPLAERNVALVVVDRAKAGPGPPPDPPLSEPPSIADFIYLRQQRTDDAEPLGYDETSLDAWSTRLRAIASEHDVFAPVIAGAKHRAPAAAMALIARTPSCGIVTAPLSR